MRRHQNHLRQKSLMVHARHQNQPLKQNRLWERQAAPYGTDRLHLPVNTLELAKHYSSRRQPHRHRHLILTRRPQSLCRLMQN